MTDTVEKVYCYDRPQASNDTAPMWAALMSKNGETPSAAEIANLVNNSGNNAQWNNPFMYLIWLCLLGGNGNGLFGNNGAAAANASQNAQISELQNSMNNNQNTNLLMDAIKGNHAAVHEVANSLGVSAASLTAAVNDVSNGVSMLAGQIGTTGERVINSVLLGNKDLTSALQSCCCENKQLIQKMGYDNQIATLNQTNDLQARLTNLANGITQGFASTAYETQKQTCDIITAANANTQSIKDLLNSHWQAETSQALQDAKFEISQLKQNQYLVGQLGNGGCNC